jgi:hypothetical protein
MVTDQNNFGKLRWSRVITKLLTKPVNTLIVPASFVLFVGLGLIDTGGWVW